MSIRPKPSNEWYFEKLSKLTKDEVWKLTLLEFLDKNKRNPKVLKRFYKINKNYSLKEFLLFLVFFFVVELLFPYSKTFNFIGIEDPVPWINLFFTGFTTFVVYVIISGLVNIDFNADVEDFGISSLYFNLRSEILYSKKTIKYYPMRFYPSFIKLEFDNLVDWFTAGNLFEE